MVCSRVGLLMSVCWTTVSSAKTAEPIEVPFGGQTCVGLRNHELDDGAHWRHMANTVERSRESVRHAACWQQFING